MQRVTQFSFRVNKDERQAIADLATRLQRSQSDAVRFVVIEAVKQFPQASPAPVLSVLAQEIDREGKNATG